jgi:hypothetical protein
MDQHDPLPISDPYFTGSQFPCWLETAILGKILTHTIAMTHLWSGWNCDVKTSISFKLAYSNTITVVFLHYTDLRCDLIL